MSISWQQITRREEESCYRLASLYPSLSFAIIGRTVFPPRRRTFTSEVPKEIGLALQASSAASRWATFNHCPWPLGRSQG